MKIIRFENSDGQVQHGCSQEDGSITALEGDLWGEFRDSGQPATLTKLLAPVIPTDIYCIGLNYAKHAAEGGMAVPEFPCVFMKASSSIHHPEDAIQLPRHLRSDEVDYECELAVVIGRPCKNVSKQEALDYVLGYTCANDVSARDWQLKWGQGQWCRGKTFDSFCPLGPCITTTDVIEDPNQLSIKTTLNGEVMQDWTTSDMIFDVPALIEFLSGSTTLLPGTVILTGTPHGIGAARKPPVFLTSGDTVTIEIEHIGALTNPVIDEPDR
ncbi:MAG: fumarylacetoacetate hydrolase family protein [Planctomycetota bacterium]